MLFLVVRPPFPGVFPEVGDAATGQQFQKAQGTHEMLSPNTASECHIKLNVKLCIHYTVDLDVITSANTTVHFHQGNLPRLYKPTSISRSLMTVCHANLINIVY